ncbi:5'-nucleotidase domain-containing protein 1 [Drosophila nasuta]|uniref:5'-nucleotidase domain-containing protein 1 n=1 Tax=Drosophila nasuta TaxID=42062 RepID=UPI00295EAD8C|nr:5'-nucleotidase domain-containing protein 1 [Drosophila nasuta]
MHACVRRVGVCQVGATTAAAITTIAREVYKQSQTDVHRHLRNGCRSYVKLAQNCTRDNNNNNQLLSRRPIQPTTAAQLITSKYSRYSASTIMNSYCKELTLMDYDIIGFDLDGTLLRYDLLEMSTLIYNVLKQYLVEHKGYSPALLTQQLDLDFLQKGLMLDGTRGNVLKLSNEAQVLRATHGTRLLSDAEIVAIYGPERRWDVTTAFYNDPLSTWNGPAALQMRALMDYFDMPAALVFAQAVDLVDKAAGGAVKEYRVWHDLLDGLMHNYSRDNFSNDKSLYFKAMRAEPQRYVLQSSRKLLDWLRELRANGKKLFLLTGSNIDFANLTATQALGADWQQQFDFVLTFAKKPGFFTMQRPFMAVDADAKREVPNSELSLQADLKLGEIYSQGNWHQLHQAMAKLLNKETSEARALYFGDNIIQDVYTPVKHRDFDTVAIVEELSMVDQQNYAFNAVVSSNFWDSYFIINNTPTLWSGFIANYAQICVSSMEQMAALSPTERIVSNNVNGFYPTLPKQLLSTNLTTSWHGGSI